MAGVTRATEHRAVISLTAPPSPAPRNDGWTSTAWKVRGTISAPAHIGPLDSRWVPRWRWSREDFERASAAHRRRVVRAVRDALDAYVRQQLGPEPEPTYWDDEDDYDW